MSVLIQVTVLCDFSAIGVREETEALPGSRDCVSGVGEHQFPR
jgi:hypothetical protein